MKKLFAVVVLVVSILGLTDTAFSQKIGYINTEELIGAMPEAATATTQLQDYQTALQQQYTDLNSELQEKDSAFVRDSAKLSSATKELRRSALIELYQKLQGFQQSTQQKLQEKQQELLTPIRNKALETIKVVGKENAYAYILDQNAVIVGPPGDDILALVKKKLNIKDKEAPKAPAARPKP
jgi:outer membrane protein